MTLELSEQIVNIGSKVRVKWLKDWYDGEVIDIVPQNNLYQVIESQTDLAILLHVSQIKPIDKRCSTHEKYSVGAKVAYYDSNLSEWQSGIIKATDAVASILVKWKRRESQVENLNWFIEADIAPVIENEAFSLEKEATDLNCQTTSTSTVAVLPRLVVTACVEDILEEKPVFRKNEAFDSPTEEEIPLEYNLPNFEQFVEDFNQPRHSDKRRTSVSMKEFYAKRFQKPISKKADTKGLHDYLENQHALLHGKIDHNILPAIWSYLHTTNGKGIPHHPASRFFFNHNASMKRAQSSMLPPHMSRSTTMASRHSEPAAHTENSRNRNPLKLIKNRKMKKNTVNMSLRPLPPEPASHYEEPISSSATANNSHNEYYETLNFSESKTGSKKESNNGSKRQTGISITSASPKKQIVSAGGSVTLFCEVKSDAPVTYEWYKDGKKLTHNDEQVAFPEPGKIQLYGLHMHNGGRYQCKISNTAQMSETFECILKVEEDTIRRSFSREFGLHKLALDDAENDETMLPSSDNQANDMTSSSLPNFDEDEKTLLRVPSYNHPLASFLKSSSMDLTRELLDKDVLRLEQESTRNNEDAAIETEATLRSDQVSKATIDERIVQKEKRRRSSNVVNNEMDTYLDGYGEDYGESSNVLAAPEFDKKKKTSKRDKTKTKQNKSGEKMKKKSPKKQPTDDSELVSSHPPTMVAERDEKMDTHTPEVEEIEIQVHSESNEEIKLQPIDHLDQDIPSYDEVTNSTAKQNAKRKKAKKYKGKIDGATAKHDVISRSNDSIDAHPEYESLTSISSDIVVNHKEDDGSQKGSNNVDLPLAVEHYTESIRRLQKSTQEYEKEHFGKENHDKPRNLLNKLLKSKNTELN